MNAQDTRSIVVAVYADLLRRAVDPEGLQKWSAHLEEGNEPDSLAAALVDSVEFRTLRIVDAYVAVLGDEPDSRTVAELVEALDAGVVDIDSLRLHVLEEVVRAERVRTDAHFVAVLYDVSLGRALPVREADFWVGQIRVQGRGEVARAVWFSDEAMRRRVRHLYLQLLHRSADDVALQTWVPVMSHHGDAAVRSGLIGSAEYRESALRRFGTHAPGLQGLR